MICYRSTLAPIPYTSYTAEQYIYPAFIMPLVRVIPPEDPEDEDPEDLDGV